jgi:1,4-alpha-glucan branching enzyme
LPPEKVTVIPNGIDPQSMRPTNDDPSFRDRYALPHEKIVLFVGRLVREKGAQVLLECVPSVLAACPHTKFIIGGKGPMLEELQQQAAQLGVEAHVCFPGFVDDESRNRLLRFSAAAVFPSLYEPFGIVALEAMAAGIPVIVSGTGGLLDIVEYGVDGWTVLPGDAASLSAHIIRTLQDEAEAARLAENAYRKVCSEYDWGGIAGRTLEAYAQIMRGAEAYTSALR